MKASGLFATRVRDEILTVDVQTTNKQFLMFLRRHMQNAVEFVNWHERNKERFEIFEKNDGKADYQFMSQAHSYFGLIVRDYRKYFSENNVQFRLMDAVNSQREYDGEPVESELKELKKEAIFKTSDGIGKVMDKTLGNYKIISEIGRGGMGVVYKAEHLHLRNKSPVAVKILPEKFSTNEILIKRFYQEADAMVGLEHPNVVKVMDMGVQDDIYYFVMELIEGQSLRQLLDKGNPLPMTRILHIAIECCNALSCAHAKGIIHRDIKPGNILISKEGNVKVSDFGLARIVGDEALSVGDLGTAIGEGSIGLIATKGSRLTKTGTSLGTVDYMSSEQREPGEETDQRTDIYSLGVVLYEMLTGRLPVGAYEQPSEVNSEASEELDRVVAGAMAARKEKRYQEIGELKSVLEKESKNIVSEEEAEQRRREEEEERRKQKEECRRDEERKRREQEEERRRQEEQRKKAKVVIRAEKPGRQSKGRRLWKVIAGIAIIVIGIAGYFLFQAGSREYPILIKPPPVKKPPSQPPVRILEEITNSIGMKLVLIPEGSFMMGSPSSEGRRESDEGPQHRVNITKSFYMSRYEVTVGEFRKFIAATGHMTDAEKGTGAYVWTGNRLEKKRDASWKNPYFAQGDKDPVVCVSWNDVAEFCKWLSEKEGVEYHLPTEAEWEYACRAGSTTAFHYGNSLSSEQANFNGNHPYGGAKKGTYREKTMVVGSFRPNGWGLYDMHGNVWEWCDDRYDNGYYSKSPVNDPKGSGSGGECVRRGGCWNDGAWNCRSAHRNRRNPTNAHHGNGFRCVRSGAQLQHEAHAPKAKPEERMVEPSKLFQSMATHEVSGNYEEALKCAEEFISKYPGHYHYSSVLESAAQYSDELKRYEKAIQYHWKFIEENPGSKKIDKKNARIGEMLDIIFARDVKLSDDFLSLLPKFLNRVPGSYRDKVVLWSAQMYLRKGKTEKAIAYFSKLLGQNRNMFSKHLDDIESALTEVFKRPENAWSPRAIMNAEMLVKQLLIHEKVNKVSLLTNITQFYEDRKDMSKALKYCELLREKSHRGVERGKAVLWKGSLLEKANRVKDAIKIYERLVAGRHHLGYEEQKREAERRLKELCSPVLPAEKK